MLAACSGGPPVPSDTSDASATDDAGMDDTADSGDTVDDVSDVTDSSDTGVPGMPSLPDDTDVDTDSGDLSDVTWCEPGKEFVTSSQTATGTTTVTATIIGETTYQGVSVCEAQAHTEMESEAGTAVSDLTYYFNQEFESDGTTGEVWILSTTTVSGSTETHTSEMHVKNGEVLSLIVDGQSLQ
ncbi:hypothetical protein GF342_05730 [Candidatus Woesearchaeota archaeon]|nr:hypothetical protein [Candidatus Woesearchaeota archaeon]